MNFENDCMGYCAFCIEEGSLLMLLICAASAQTEHDHKETRSGREFRPIRGDGGGVSMKIVNGTTGRSGQ